MWCRYYSFVTRLVAKLQPGTCCKCKITTLFPNHNKHIFPGDVTTETAMRQYLFFLIFYQEWSCCLVNEKAICQLLTEKALLQDEVEGRVLRRYQ